MLRMIETYKALAEGKDLESFRIGYYCRQEHIDILEEEIAKLEVNSDYVNRRKMIFESLERLINKVLDHERSNCTFCDTQSDLFDMIEDKLDELKSIR